MIHEFIHDIAPYRILPVEVKSEEPNQKYGVLLTFYWPVTWADLPPEMAGTRILVSEEEGVHQEAVFLGNQYFSYN